MLYDLGLVFGEEVPGKADRAHESGRSRMNFRPAKVTALVQAGAFPKSSLLDAVAAVIDHDWEGKGALAESASGMTTLPVKLPAPIIDFDCKN